MTPSRSGTSALPETVMAEGGRSGATRTVRAAAADLAPVPPIGPYTRPPLVVEDWDPRTADVARRLAAMINARRPDLQVEHTGSSSVPGLPGKNVVDLGIET